MATYPIVRALEADDICLNDEEWPRGASSLTAREGEVAALIARGYSNRRIGERLVIAERTVETHARNIREKLGLVAEPTWPPG